MSLGLNSAWRSHNAQFMARLLTCPDCGASYRVPEDALSPKGQTVRCQRCDNSWFAPGEDTSTPDALELADLEADEKLARVTAPEPVGAVDMVPANDQAPRAAHVDKGLGAAAMLRDRTYQKKRRAKLNVIAIIWGVTAAILFIAALLAIFTRHSLVQRYPQLAGTFNAVGLQTSPSGFTLSPVEARQLNLDGQDFLVVSGEAVNLTGRTRPAPLVEMALFDTGGGELARWSVDVGGEVGPRARRSYTSEYPNPPLDAVELRWGLER